VGGPRCRRRANAAAERGLRAGSVVLAVQHVGRRLLEVQHGSDAAPGDDPGAQRDRDQAASEPVSHRANDGRRNTMRMASHSGQWLRDIRILSIVRLPILRARVASNLDRSGVSSRQTLDTARPVFGVIYFSLGRVSFPVRSLPREGQIVETGFTVAAAIDAPAEEARQMVQDAMSRGALDMVGQANRARMLGGKGRHRVTLVLGLILSASSDETTRRRLAAASAAKKGPCGPESPKARGERWRAASTNGSATGSLDVKGSRRGSLHQASEPTERPPRSTTYRLLWCPRPC
jgi:hypothetical protein